MTSKASLQLLGCITILTLALANTAFSKSIFDDKTPEQLLIEAGNLLPDLIINDTEARDQAISVRARQAQLLLREKQYLELKLKPEAAISYLHDTKICLGDPSVCLAKTKIDPDSLLSSFYTWITPEDLSLIQKSLVEIDRDRLTYRRAKVLNLAIKSLLLGVQEADGPNDDTRSGENLIDQYFVAAGIYDPAKEFNPNRVDWAWCAAYVSAIINQAGGGFSFISLDQHNKACAEMKQKSHCHPVQVEFILNWAKRKNKAIPYTLSSLDRSQPGDLLILMSPKSGRAGHIGFYLAHNQDWVYSIEGNTGPNINDLLEDDWQAVKAQIKTTNTSTSDYERLLDRVSIVKRPLESWAYIVTL
ncbi:MAG: hypothetical protein SFT81_02025 [Candidatus Caenarcaniphilales bacterium]|nr:hypothetical protein [Candidatus Caenarcaniphilales bacterium]